MNEWASTLQQQTIAFVRRRTRSVAASAFLKQQKWKRKKNRPGKHDVTHPHTRELDQRDKLD